MSKKPCEMIKPTSECQEQIPSLPKEETELSKPTQKYCHQEPNQQGDVPTQESPSLHTCPGILNLSPCGRKRKPQGDPGGLSQGMRKTSVCRKNVSDAQEEEDLLDQLRKQQERQQELLNRLVDLKKKSGLKEDGNTKIRKRLSKKNNVTKHNEKQNPGDCKSESQRHKQEQQSRQQQQQQSQQPQQQQQQQQCLLFDQEESKQENFGEQQPGKPQQEEQHQNAFDTQRMNSPNSKSEPSPVIVSTVALRTRRAAGTALTDRQDQHRRARTVHNLTLPRHGLPGGQQEKEPISSNQQPQPQLLLGVKQQSYTLDNPQQKQLSEEPGQINQRDYAFPRRSKLSENVQKSGDWSFYEPSALRSSSPGRVDPPEPRWYFAQKQSSRGFCLKESKKNRDRSQDKHQARTTGQSRILQKNKNYSPRSPCSMQHQVLRENQDSLNRREKKGKISCQSHDQHHRNLHRQRHRSVDPRLHGMSHSPGSHEPRRVASDFQYLDNHHDPKKAFPFEFNEIDNISQNIPPFYQQHNKRRHQQRVEQQPKPEQDQSSLCKQEKPLQSQLSQCKPGTTSSFPLCGGGKITLKRFRSQPSCFKKENISALSKEGLSSLLTTDLADFEAQPKFKMMPVLPPGCAWYPPPPVTHIQKVKAASRSCKKNPQSNYKATSKRHGPADRCVFIVHIHNNSTIKGLEPAKTDWPSPQPSKVRSTKFVPLRTNARLLRYQNSFSPETQNLARKVDSMEFAFKALPPGAGVWLSREIPTLRPSKKSAVKFSALPIGGGSKALPPSHVSYRDNLHNLSKTKVAAQVQSPSHESQAIQNSGKGRVLPGRVQARLRKSLTGPSLKDRAKRLLEGPKSLSAELLDSSVTVSPLRGKQLKNSTRRGRKPWRVGLGHSVPPRKNRKPPNNGTAALPSTEKAQSLKNTQPSFSSQNETRSLEKTQDIQVESAKADVSPQPLSAAVGVNKDLLGSSYPLDGFGGWTMSDQILSQMNGAPQGVEDDALQTEQLLQCCWERCQNIHQQIANVLPRTDISPLVSSNWLSTHLQDAILGFPCLPYLSGRTKQRGVRTVRSISLPSINPGRTATLNKLRANMDIFRCGPELRTCALDPDACKKDSPSYKSFSGGQLKTLQFLSVSPRVTKSLPTVGLKAGVQTRFPSSVAQERLGDKLALRLSCASSASSSNSEQSGLTRSAFDEIITCSQTKAATSAGESWIKRRQSLSPNFSPPSSAVLRLLGRTSKVTAPGTQLRNRSKSKRKLQGDGVESGSNCETTSETSRHCAGVVSWTAAPDPGVEKITAHANSGGADTEHHRRWISSRECWNSGPVDKTSGSFRDRWAGPVFVVCLFMLAVSWFYYTFQITMSVS
ncbi:hypothetical protein PoB_006897500 [Plakobranchus ocellatus]|uniref:Uncharacterized protein n=1 Tax=Plakobranchus ocellatus TaxID=259542 RepID=A0AAV4DEP8_9GAST|nr:hypothetical protein PoB_006897500 [Plakobranchus ocellatus]